MVRTEWCADDDGRPSKVLVVTLDRPERRNAVDHSTLTALQLAQRQAADARALVLTGEPPVFCAGADLGGVEGADFADLLGAVLRGFTELSIPTIAAVEGAALGVGTQLAIVCDLRVATATSRFAIPAARLGLVVDHWTVRRLTREVGWSISRAMLLGGATYDGAALHSAGAVHRLGGLDVALEWAHELAQLAPLTIAAHKLALERAVVDPEADELVEDARTAVWRSDDANEGRRAFLEKRPPHFHGR